MNSGRKPLKTPSIIDAEATLDQPAFANAVTMMQQEGALKLERLENSRALAARLGYAGSLALDMLEDGVVESVRRVNEKVFGMGTRLLLIREQCAHGEFIESLSRMRVLPRQAQKLMQATAKFAGLLSNPNAPSKAHLEALGKTKIFELLTLDDDEVADFVETGSVRGISADHMAEMSVSELKRALRDSAAKVEELTAEITAKEARLSVKQRLLDEAEEKVERFKALSPDKQLIELQDSATTSTREVLCVLSGRFRHSLQNIADHCQNQDADERVFMSGLVKQIQHELVRVNDMFMLEGAIPLAPPEWMTDSRFNTFAPDAAAPLKN